MKFENENDLAGIPRLLHETFRVVVQNNTDTNTYSMPVFAHDKDEVFIGRIRRDEKQPNILNMCIVADNLRKSTKAKTI